MYMKLKKNVNLFINMGLRYLLFRIFYMIKVKLGLLKKQFPENVSQRTFISKHDWLKLNVPFLLPNSTFVLADTDKLKARVNNIFHHKFTFFSSTEYALGKDYDWITNPETGYKYNINTHWSEIEDFSKQAGDIKYVWEKARFSFVYDVIRYDKHFDNDSSKFIFTQIESFIDKNPINKGPNYKCSQEISLRILNWTFALFYYKNSKHLSEELFEKIINSIYWQLHHVYGNINFSRIAVRNNHAITETAMLYLSNLLFPFIPETKRWSEQGYHWLLKEINYQIYDDGSYLQFSHNYHRVVIQILTWVLAINKLNNKSFDEQVIDRLKKTLNFLYQHQDIVSGKLPNYGNNDGALFFPLNSNNYRNFKPQLQAFGLLLGIKLYDKLYEDAYWYNLQNEYAQNNSGIEKQSILSFSKGGFYGIYNNSLTTVRCGVYKDRPSQADNLHLDIWHNGENLLFDPGTYKYNTEDRYIKFNVGTSGHNTLSIGKHDQMLKGSRFIWYFWTKHAKANVLEYNDRFEFDGELIAFPLAGKKIKHRRKIIKEKGKSEWVVIDEINYKGKEKVYLNWNVNQEFLDNVEITATDIHGNCLEMYNKIGWNSEKYGMKEEYKRVICEITDNYCKTIIKIK